MKVILALLENMNCQNNMEWIMGKLLGELHLTTNSKNPRKEYILFILQTISMCFFNNAQLAF
jgi:hypothetical protein